MTLCGYCLEVTWPRHYSSPLCSSSFMASVSLFPYLEWRCIGESKKWAAAPSLIVWRRWLALTSVFLKAPMKSELHDLKDKALQLERFVKMIATIQVYWCIWSEYHKKFQYHISGFQFRIYQNVWVCLHDIWSWHDDAMMAIAFKVR